MFRTTAELIDAITEATGGGAQEPLGGAAPGGDFATAADITQVEVRNGLVYVVTSTDVPADDLKDIYINDSEWPAVETPAEALDAARNFFLRLGSRIVANGTPRRNDDRARWEIPVSTRRLPTPLRVRPVMQIPARDWKIFGSVELSDRTGRTAPCCCCGKQSDELVAMFLTWQPESLPHEVTDQFQIDIRHYARRTGVTVEEAREEVDAAHQAARDEIKTAEVAREPGTRNSWALYRADGEPVDHRVFPHEENARAALDEILELATAGPVSQYRVDEALERHGGVAKRYINPRPGKG